MPTKQPSRTGTRSKTKDAIALLTEDHKRVQKLFKDFGKLKEGEDERKQDLANTICAELTIHTRIEEEIFYPAARGAIKEGDLLDEAKVEHDSAKDLIEQISSMQPGEELYDAKVTVLGEYVNHHIEEEQTEMFPKVRKAKVDIKGLGEQLMARKQELRQEMGLGEAETVEKKTPRKSTTQSARGSKGGRAKSASGRSKSSASRGGKTTSRKSSGREARV